MEKHVDKGGNYKAREPSRRNDRQNYPSSSLGSMICEPIKQQAP